MRDRTETHISPRLLAAYVDGEVTPSEAAAVEKVLSESAELRRRAQDLRHIKHVLSSDLAGVGAVDLKARVRLAIDREQAAASETGAAARRRSAFRLWPAGLAAVVACAAAVVLVVRPHQVPVTPSADTESEFRAKGAGKSETAGGRWAGITIFHVTGSQAPKRLGAQLPADDGLLFSYTNVGPAPFDYLLIFGVDARGEMHWFFPARESEHANPSSMAIEKGKAKVDLAELLHDQFPAGRLVVHAIFSRQPIWVQEVEVWLKEAPGGTLPWPEAHQQTFITTVK